MFVVGAASVVVTGEEVAVSGTSAVESVVEVGDVSVFVVEVGKVSVLVVVSGSSVEVFNDKAIGVRDGP